MAIATHTATHVAIFDTPAEARRAIEALHRAGFQNHQITMVHHHTPEGDKEVTDLDAAKAAQVSGESREGEGTAVGAVAGAILGGAIAVGVLSIPGLGASLVAGGLIASTAIAGLATGVVGGAVGGGIVGALVGLDIPEEDALLYEQELKAGRALVGVHAGGRTQEAWDILRANGGHELAHAVAAAPVVDTRL
ncbi:MAG TPA: hypothetical protein VFW33_10495 [Gemmataceae bacterium]|nr:hypothetical protein [Gemmataceae bacterium]